MSNGELFESSRYTSAVELQKQVRPAPPQTAPVKPELELSSEELSEVLQRASSIQTMKQNSGRDVTTLNNAIETARELGIAEEHVLEAAGELRRRKEHFGRLKSIARKRRNNFVRMIGTTMFVVTMVFFFGGMNAAQAVLFGMSIALVVLAGRWGRALLAQRYPDLFDTPAPNECRLCGERAWDRKAQLCREHLKAIEGATGGDSSR